MTPSPLLAKIQANRHLPVTDAEREAVQKRVSRARVRLAQFYPFYGYLILKLEIQATRRVLIAAVTTDRKLLVNPDWLAEAPEAEVNATFMHEVLHPALLVWDRIGAREIKILVNGAPYPLFFVAHDFAINQIIQDEGQQAATHELKKNVPLLDPKQWDPPGLLDAKYKGWSAEAIYDNLAKNLKPGKPEPIPGMGESMVDVLDGEGEISPASEAEQTQFWKVSLLEAAQVNEMSSMRGDLPVGIKLIIHELLNPRVPWVEVLSRWVGENGRREEYSWRRLNRRSDSVGELMPSLQRSGVSDVCVLWDTSGSMIGRETEILSEVLGMCQDLGLSLRVICCDAAIHSDQSNVENAEDIDVLGGGGSDFTPAFERLVEEGYAGVVVAFTDGAIGVPKTKPDSIQGVLWVIWHRDTDPTGGTWGETIYVDADDQVRKNRK